jgi:hypothetical protein
MKCTKLRRSYLSSKLETQFRFCITSFAEHEESGTGVDEEDDWALKEGQKPGNDVDEENDGWLKEGRSHCSVCRLNLGLSKTESETLHYLWCSLV